MSPFLVPDSLKFLAGTDITVTEASGRRQESKFTDNMNLMNGGIVPTWGAKSNLVQSSITSASNYAWDFLNMNNGR